MLLIAALWWEHYPSLAFAVLAIIVLVCMILEREEYPASPDPEDKEIPF